MHGARGGLEGRSCQPFKGHIGLDKEHRSGANEGPEALPHVFVSALQGGSERTSRFAAESEGTTWHWSGRQHIYITFIIHTYKTIKLTEN